MSSLRAPIWLEAKITASSSALKVAHEAADRAARLHREDPELIAACNKVIEIMRRTHLELLSDLHDHILQPVTRDERRQAHKA